MKAKLNGTLLLAVILGAASVRAATLYVDATSTNALPPYTNWLTAAVVIQDAVDAAAPGDEVVVTNGMYATGGRAVYGTMTNRVAVDRAITLRSLNGPELTFILGARAPGGGNGDGAIRCVYLTNGAVLSGFTLTNGATGTLYSSGHQEDSGGGVWCQTTNAVVTNCTLSGNMAMNGGGAYSGTLNNCTLTGNFVTYSGGGACSCTLNHCVLTSNWTENNGGGAFGGTLSNCTLSGNRSARNGGGVDYATLNNCVVTWNQAMFSGGVDDSTLNHCIVAWNRARYGGGVGYSSATNCVIYHNVADTYPNHEGALVSYSCTWPAPTNGAGNITNEPQLASFSHLSAGSPCRGAGAPEDVTGVDIDGEEWLSPPSIGCDEYRAGAVTGAVTVAIETVWTNVPAGYALDLTGWISGRVSASTWDLGDGTVFSNRPCVSHAWSAPGDYPVVLRAWNESHPAGISATVTVQVVTLPVHHVAVASTNPVPPYNSWETAAQTIQDAVDAATLPGALVLVTNGVYASGGRAVYGTMTNRVAVDRSVVLRSVNGPKVTMIAGIGPYGDEAIRCVYLTNGAVLSGFTLTNGATRASGHQYLERSGGGVWCEQFGALVTNCTIAGNSATWMGGGAYYGTLNNCILVENTAYGGGGAYFGVLNNCSLFGNSADHGGGAQNSDMNNCTLTGNSADYYGGGALGGWLKNCIVYYNAAGDDSNYYGCSLDYCCTTPAATNGVGNITLEPRFTDQWHRNFRLLPGSPCINAGFNDYAPAGPDSTGNPRILDGTVDIGALEYREWVPPTVHYVSAISANPESPYSSWETAAPTIQDAVYAAQPGDTVLVTNGIYATGGRAVAEFMTNRVAVDKPITVRSVNGPEVTVIKGYQVPDVINGVGAVRCVLLTNGATLSGFTVSNGATWSGGIDYNSGGGVFCASDRELVTNCIIAANAASSRGGGAYLGTLKNCILTSNSAFQGGGYANGTVAYIGKLVNCTFTGNTAVFGGGAYFNPTSIGTMDNCRLIANSASFGGATYGGVLKNCALTRNAASTGGGAFWGTLRNCIVYYNTAGTDPNCHPGTVTFCCTTPLPSGAGNIAAEPLFMDLDAGDLRLQSNSPCINAGNNAYVTNSTDLDNYARIAGGTVDMGAYEFQSPDSVISYAWLQQFGLPSDGTADFTDPDGDGFNTWKEWRCLTDPTNMLSFLRLLPPVPGGTNVTLIWPSGAGRSYVLECSTNLGATPPFFPLVQSLPGKAGTTTFTHTNGAGLGPCFYRVAVP